MKKRISYLLVFCLVFSTCLTAAAASNDNGGKSLENAITAAKSIVNVPAEYTNLSQYSYETEYNGVKTDVWQLSWSHPEGKGHVSVTIDNSGNILNFYQYIYRDKTPGISDFSSAEGKPVADTFLKKVWPAYADQMRIEADSSAGGIQPYPATVYPSDSFQYAYRLYVNDLPVEFVTASISVDKYSKEVVSFNRSYTNPAQYNFSQDVSGLISEEAATAAYIENIGLDIEYFSYYNDKQQTMMVFPAYVLQNSEGQVIDAKTGKAVNRYSEEYAGLYGAAGGMADMERNESSASAKEASLTPEEQSAVDTVSGLISKTEAEKIARTLPGITSGMKVQSTSLQNEYYDQAKYVWNLNFDQCYVSLNAKTGEIYSYSLYDNTGNGRKNLKVDEAQKNAEAFLQQYAKEKFANVKYETNPLYYTLKEAADGTATWIPNPNPIEDRVYYFYYTRQVDGVDFGNNTISVSVDRTTGEVISYYLSWYDNISFPSLDYAMSKEDIFGIFDNYADFSLSYALTGKNQAAPVYDFANKENVMIQPDSGTRLDWDGQPYQRNMPAYKDISGHWAEKTILTLAENGYYLNSGGELFYPDSNVTQLDFFLYCYSQAVYSNVDYLYDMLYREGILTEAERNPKATVSRQQAAKYIARIMGFEKLAQNEAIFKDVAKDSITSGYKGYVAIAAGLKIMNVDAKGNFNPAKTLTNAETAAIVYNYLQVK